MKKPLWITIGVVAILLSVLVWYKFFFVFGEGVKSGILNSAMNKGYVFKTYEGKLIQEGFGGNNKGEMQSYEFEFSVSDPEVFKQLETNSAKHFDLHYKEYKSSLPWRGNSRYVVDKIVNIR